MASDHEGIQKMNEEKEIDLALDQMMSLRLTGKQDEAEWSTLASKVQSHVYDTVYRFILAGCIRPAFVNDIADMEDHNLVGQFIGVKEQERTFVTLEIHASEEELELKNALIAAELDVMQSPLAVTKDMLASGATISARSGDPLESEFYRQDNDLLAGELKAMWQKCHLTKNDQIGIKTCANGDHLVCYQMRDGERWIPNEKTREAMEDIRSRFRFDQLEAWQCPYCEEEIAFSRIVDGIERNVMEDHS